MGNSHAEIAAALGLSATQVPRRMSKLRALLAAWKRDEQ
jgi:DNA-directed RNA polymerase specialized sigma24 family protein